MLPTIFLIMEEQLADFVENVQFSLVQKKKNDAFTILNSIFQNSWKTSDAKYFQSLLYWIRKNKIYCITKSYSYTKPILTTWQCGFKSTQSHKILFFTLLLMEFSFGYYFLKARILKIYQYNFICLCSKRY